MDERLEDIVERFRSGSLKLNGLKKLVTNDPDILEQMRALTDGISINGKSEVSQRMFHLANCTNASPTCPVCGSMSRKFRDATKGYYKTCSEPECFKTYNTRSGRETCRKRYGTDSFFQTDEFKLMVREKLGVDNPFQLQRVKDKIKETNMRRFGVDHPMKDVSLCKRAHDKIRKSNIVVINENIGVRHNVEVVSGDFGKFDVLCNDCKTMSSFLNSYFNFRRRNGIKPCLKCVPIRRFTSKDHLEIIEFVGTFYGGAPIINDRSTINGELDCYYPDKKIAIEVNGIFYHGELMKEKNYHLEKRVACEEKGIRLVQVWQDLWKNNGKREIIKSRVRNIFGMTGVSLYARTMSVCEVTKKDEKTFLDRNHLQGYVHSSVRYGLYDKSGKMVSIMTFGRRRKSMGLCHVDGSFELLRFCSTLDTSVIGAAGKLFSHFVKSNTFHEVISYANRDWSDGKLYEKLGFDLVGETPPNYWWIVNNERRHRFNFRKDVLVRMGADPNKSERDIMYEQRCWRIYDSGNFKFSYKKRGSNLL